MAKRNHKLMATHDEIGVLVNHALSLVENNLPVKVANLNGVIAIMIDGYDIGPKGEIVKAKQMELAA